MKKKSNSKIEIGNVKGDVIISQDQKGGITSHSVNDNKPNRRRKWAISSVVFFIAAVVTILTYLNIDLPNDSMNSKQDVQNSNILLSDTTNEISNADSSTTITSEVKMTKKKDEKTTMIDKVEGDLVISYNQTGGQTAHTINNYAPMKRPISPSVKTKMLEILNKFSDQKIGFASTQGDREAAKYKNLLMSIFNEGGWNVIDMHTFMFFGDKEGLVVTIPFKAPETGIPQVVASILSLTGNTVSGNRGDMANECEVYVQVWHNPE